MSSPTQAPARFWRRHCSQLCHSAPIWELFHNNVQVFLLTPIQICHYYLCQATSFFVYLILTMLAQKLLL